MIKNLIILVLLIIIIMGKNRQRKAEKKQRYKEEQKEKIRKYIYEFSSFCKGKTLRQIIEDYCLAFDELNKTKSYKSLFEETELNTIIK